jgi:hypothetical protein
MKTKKYKIKRNIKKRENIKKEAVKIFSFGTLNIKNFRGPSTE